MGFKKTKEIHKFELEVEHLHSFKNLYKMMHNWLEDNGFVSTHGKGDDKFETLYFEQVVQSGAKNQHIWWRVKKKTNNPDFAEYRVNVDFQTLNQTQGQAMIDGKKVKGDQSNTIIRIKAVINYDYKNNLENHWLWKHFADRYMNFWNQKKNKNMEDFLKAKIEEFQKEIKQYLEMEDGNEIPENFFFGPNGL